MLRMRNLCASHKRDDLNRKTSAIGFAHFGAACSAAEQLSFACRLCTATWIDETRVGGWALMLVLRSRHQLAASWMWRMWCLRVISKKRQSKNGSFQLCRVLGNGRVLECFLERPNRVDVRSSNHPNARLMSWYWVSLGLYFMVKCVDDEICLSRKTYIPSQ